MALVMLSPSTVYTPEYGSSTPTLSGAPLPAGFAAAAGAVVAAAAGTAGFAGAGPPVVGAQPASHAPPARRPAARTKVRRLTRREDRVLIGVRSLPVQRGDGPNAAARRENQ